MSFAKMVGDIAKGLGSVLFHTHALKELLSSSIKLGIEGGIAAATPSLLRLVGVGAVLATGIFLLGTGFATWMSPFFETPGVGSMVAGIILLAVGGFYVYSQK
ncbi:MAG: hypothetical protein AABY11_04020 [archaeon]